jgi:hypothetical protein
MTPGMANNQNKKSRRTSVFGRLWSRADNFAPQIKEIAAGNRVPAPVGESTQLCAQVDTDPHRSAPINSGAKPVSSSAHEGVPSSMPSAADELDLLGDLDKYLEDNPFAATGAIRTPKEHAVQLLQTLRLTIQDSGLEELSLYYDAIREMHCLMCEDLGWCGRSWNSVGREFKKLPGVREGKVLNPSGKRLTYYEIGPLSEAGAVKRCRHPRPVSEIACGVKAPSVPSDRSREGLERCYGNGVRR